MNIVSVKQAGECFVIDHIVDTHLGRQTWTTTVQPDSEVVADWIANGGEVLPEDVPVVTAQPTIADIIEALPQESKDALASKLSERLAVVAVSPAVLR